MTMSASPTVSKLEYNATLRFANAVARAGEALGLRLGRLDASSILAAARRQTGLDDWGDDAFIVPMKKVVAVPVQPRKVRFGPSPFCGGASDMSSGSLPMGSTPIGSRLMAVRRPGGLSLIAGIAPSLIVTAAPSFIAA